MMHRSLLLFSLLGLVAFTVTGCSGESAPSTGSATAVPAAGANVDTGSLSGPVVQAVLGTQAVIAGVASEVTVSEAFESSCESEQVKYFFALYSVVPGDVAQVESAITEHWAQQGYPTTDGGQLSTNVSGTPLEVRIEDHTVIIGGYSQCTDLPATTPLEESVQTLETAAINLIETVVEPDGWTAQDRTEPCGPGTQRSTLWLQGTAAVPDPRSTAIEGMTTPVVVGQRTAAQRVAPHGWLLFSHNDSDTVMVTAVTGCSAR